MRTRPEGVSLVLKNCTIAANWSKHTAGGLWMDGIVENSILYHNVSLVEPGDNPEPLEDQQFQGEIQLRFCTVEGLRTPDSEHPGTISANPQFVAVPLLSNPTAFFPNYTPGNLHVQAGSPCIDAGDNGAVPQDVTTDLEDQPRFIDDPATPDTGLGTPPMVDMGAYEFQPTSPIPGDLNSDGLVDVNDLLMLIGAWGPCPAPPADCPADINDDSVVDVNDLLLLIGAWG